MDRASKGEPEESSDLLVDIVETLETYGLAWDEYQLYDYVDVEALAKLLNSASGDVEVQFVVEGIRLAVTPESVDALGNGEPTAD